MICPFGAKVGSTAHFLVVFASRVGISLHFKLAPLVIMVFQPGQTLKSAPMLIFKTYTNLQDTSLSEE